MDLRCGEDVDDHTVNAGVLVDLMVERAGHVCGLDEWAEGHLAGQKTRMLRRLIA